MFDFDRYQHICANLLSLMKIGRGGIYVGGFNVLGTNMFGQQMIIDSRHAFSLKTLYVPPAVETSILALMLHQIQKGMVCIDVGAGCGFYSLVAAAVSGPNGKLYSFEVIPECYKLLKENMEMNNVETVTSVHAPVLDKTEKIDYFYFGENYQFFFLNKEANHEKQVSIESLNLDHYFADKESSIDFVKINVEKSLPAIIRGMDDILLFNPNIKILCPFNKQKIIENGEDPEQFLSTLTSKKLKIHLLPSLNEIEKEDLLSFKGTKHIFLAKSL